MGSLPFPVKGFLAKGRKAQGMPIGEQSDLGFYSDGGNGWGKRVIC
jgi:hypothetical protein